MIEGLRRFLTDDKLTIIVNIADDFTWNSLKSEN